MRNAAHVSRLAYLAAAIGIGMGAMGGAEVIGRGYGGGLSTSRRRSRPKKARQRLAPARQGGNWQGVPYLSYAEHDRCVRATFGLKTKSERDLAYRAELERITASR